MEAAIPPCTPSGRNHAKAPATRSAQSLGRNTCPSSVLPRISYSQGLLRWVMGSVNPAAVRVAACCERSALGVADMLPFRDRGARSVPMRVTPVVIVSRCASASAIRSFRIAYERAMKEHHARSFICTERPP